MTTDLIGGQVQVAIDVLTGALPHIKSGAVRALAMAGATRYDGLPDVPTIGEDRAAVRCELLVRSRRAARHAARHHCKAQQRDHGGTEDPAVKERLAAIATTPLFFTPGEFGTYIGAEIEKWAKVVRAAHIKIQ